MAWNPPAKPASFPFAAEVELTEDTVEPSGAVQVRLLIGETRPGEAVRFRMGFTPLGSKNTAWSDVTTVRVAEP